MTKKLTVTPRDSAFPKQYAVTQIKHDQKLRARLRFVDRQTEGRSDGQDAHDHSIRGHKKYNESVTQERSIELDTNGHSNHVDNTIGCTGWLSGSMFGFHTLMTDFLMHASYIYLFLQQLEGKQKLGTYFHHIETTYCIQYNYTCPWQVTLMYLPPQRCRSYLCPRPISLHTHSEIFKF